jgi:hypothetical protein
MKNARTLLFIVAASIPVTAWSGAPKGLHGKFTVFDAPGVGTTNSLGTSVSGFNQEGVIVGATAAADGTLDGFMRNRDGSFISISDPSSPPGAQFGSIPFGVNSNDQVVGIYEAGTSQYLFTSFERDRSGVFRDLHAPGAQPGLIDTIAYGINSRGEITGQYFLPDGTNQSFVRMPNGTFDKFTALGAVSTNATSINDGGSVAGTYTDSAFASHGFVRNSAGVITEFDAPGAGTGASQGTSPLSIYPSGVIVGSFVDGNSVTHGFVRDTKGSITVVDVPFATSTTVSGVDGSETVGSYIDMSGVTHGFILLHNGSVQTLDAPKAGTTSGLGTTVVGVASEGLIIGYDLDSNGASHGFVWRSDDD